jgi:hypothetical protein
MVSYAGEGHTFWQLRLLSPKPSFTAHPQNAIAADASNSATARAADASDAENSIRAGHQDEKLPQLVGGGLGVPGSKERVLKILREKGYVDVIPVVEVGLLCSKPSGERQGTFIVDCIGAYLEVAGYNKGGWGSTIQQLISSQGAIPLVTLQLLLAGHP